MTSNLLITIILLIIPFCMCLYLGLRVLRRRQFRGAVSFAFMMLVMGWWCLSAMLVVLSPNDESASFWLRSMFAFSAYLPVFTFFTTVQVAGQGQPLSLRALSPWLIVPTITAVLSLTSAYHNWHYYDFGFVRGSSGEVIGITDENGGWAIFHLIFSYAIAGYSVLLLVRQWLIIRIQTFRIRILLLLIGIAVPLAASAINTLVFEQHTFITPMSFIIVVPLLYRAFSRYRLFDLSPIARSQAFEQMSEAVIIVDTEQRVVDVNPSAARLAQTAGALIGRPLAEIFPAFGELLESADPSATQPITPSGESEPRHYEGRISPISRDGQPVGNLLLLRDVTEQQQAREQVRRNDIEAERIRTVSAFIEAISHEIRTPLTTIKTATYLINRIDDVDKRREKTQQIDRQVEAVSQLVDSLITVLRLSPQMKSSFAPQDINELAQHAIVPLQTEFTARSVRLETTFGQELPSVIGSEDYLQDAIHAVLHNALRYTAAGGSVSLSTRAQDGHVTLTISDTGIGIAPEHLPHIFDLFYRADKARTTTGFGTGLAVANRVMELHDGTITATSTISTGSTFVMTLPAQKV